MNFINHILEFIFPPTCGICEKMGEGYICQDCYQKIKKYLFENKNEKEKIHLLRYEDIVREKMLAYKFSDKSYLYRMFCDILVKSKKTCEFIRYYDIIIPVPIHDKRKKTRGYNQSELIAKELASYFKIKIYTDVLKKIANTVPQSKLGKKEREKNVRNVYIVRNIEKIIGKKVLILDDIYTTGTTANECKRILKLSGASEIGIITIAKD